MLSLISLISFAVYFDIVSSFLFLVIVLESPFLFLSMITLLHKKRKNIQLFFMFLKINYLTFDSKYVIQNHLIL